MNTQALRKSSTNDKVIMSVMAALVMFIAGYTATRMSLNAGTTVQDDGSTENMVIPHQAEMWKDFAG